VAIGDGYRETKASWLELLLDLKKRGLKAGPRLAVGDGAMAATRAEAQAAFDRFVSIYAAKYPKASETLKKDRDSLLAFYAFPAEHWRHLRTTNAIESTFATVRHRTTRTRNCVSRPPSSDRHSS
jgi:transposase-like protein